MVINHTDKHTELRLVPLIALGTRLTEMPRAVLRATQRPFALQEHRRNTVSTSQLYDVSTSDVIWKAQTETEAGGALFMSDDSTGGNLASSIIDELVAKGHVIVKK